MSVRAAAIASRRVTTQRAAETITEARCGREVDDDGEVARRSPQAVGGEDPAQAVQMAPRITVRRASAPRRPDARAAPGGPVTMGRGSTGGLPWPRRGLFALLFTATWYLANGYRVGVEDHALLIPLAAREVDPTHLAGDYIVATTHPTFLWKLLAPAVDLLGLEPAYAAIHALCVFGLGLAIIALTGALFGRRRDRDDRRVATATADPDLEATTAVALALAAPSLLTLAGIQSLDNLLIPRVVSLGPLLYAVALGVRGRFVAAFALAGLVFNLHPTTAAHGAVLVGGLWLVARAPGFARALVGRRRETDAGVLRGAGELAAFFVAGLPMLAATIVGGGLHVPFPYTQEWYELATVVFPYHHFLERLSPLVWLLGLMPWSVWLSARMAGIGARATDALMLTIPAFCALGYLLIEAVRVPQAIALHVFESTRFASYIAPILMARWILAATAELRARASLLGLAAGALYVLHVLYLKAASFSLTIAGIALVLPCLAVVGGPLPRTAPSPRRARAVAGGLVAAVVLVSITARKPVTLTVAESTVRDYRDLLSFMVPAPAEATEREASGLEVMQWAEATLPADAVVAVPPGFIHPLVNLRVVGERAIFATWKDGGEAFFSAAFAATWRARIERVGGEGVTRSFPPGPISFRRWIDRTNEAIDNFNHQPAPEFRALARDYGVTHVIRDARAPLDLPEIYSDRAFRAYRID
jgi:hypothetical protein